MLFHVFNYYRTSIQIILFYKFLWTNLAWIRNSYKFFNHIQKQPLEVFHKKAILKKFVIFKGKHLSWGLFFIKVPSLQASNCFKKGASTQIFSYECWEIYKNTYFEEHLRMAASRFLETVLWEHSLFFRDLFNCLSLKWTF